MAMASPALRSHSPLPLPLVKTPASDGPMLPSELPRSPLSAIKLEEEDIKTPITPPTAYTDFLRALSPAVSTPMTSSSIKSPFSFSDKSGHLTPISQPSSAGSNCSCRSEENRKVPEKAAECPPTPFVIPAPSRQPSIRTPTTLRKLRIPQSPSSVISQSPRSATPKSAAPRSAVPKSAVCKSATARSATTPRSAVLRSPFSPTSWAIEGKTKIFGAPTLSAAPRHISVKQVVTRTVTYTSTPLEPAPKGKRRKIE